MADVEEPQFTSLAQRIAALKQQQAEHRAAPSVPPPTRPTIESRSRTINVPPVPSPPVAKKLNGNTVPGGVRQNGILPPPPVERDQHRSPPTPQAHGKPAPPPLPSRKSTQPSPALPPRTPSMQLNRKASNSSIQSYSSTISGMSLGHASSNTSVSSKDGPRNLPPAFDQAKLPPLPPSRRDLEQKTATHTAKIPLESAKSAPSVLKPPVIDRDRDVKPAPPKLPSRPSLPPRVPPRQPSRNNLAAEENSAPQPAKSPSPAPKKLPPPANATVTRSALTMGFGAPKPKINAPSPVPVPAPVPVSIPVRDAIGVPASVPTPPHQADGSILELTSSNFNSIVMSGKPALVDFYAPFCKYCKELDPIYKELADNFAYAKDQVTIAKLDAYEHKDLGARFDVTGWPTLLFFDGRNETPEVYSNYRNLEYLTQFIEEKTGVQSRPGGGAGVGPKVVSNGAVPPPIPVSSRPSFSQVDAVKSRPSPAPRQHGCLLCRDFSGPDNVGAQYPRESIPRGDVTGYLAEVLCGPFSSATDKARAIFTWLHHNIAYDTAAFFGGNVRHVDPKDTVASGLAVCGGYAGLFLDVAQRAGLECVMVTGHGKGYGFSALKPGQAPPPRDPSGHAWNAVRIDDGEWKLIDCCWGAGHIHNQVYNKKFNPAMFTMPNDDFGLKHFPRDDAYFFRSDGSIPTWEDYIRGPTGAEPLQLYSCIPDHGLSETSFLPAAKHIPVTSDPEAIIRFQFTKVCEHWDHERNGTGRPYCFILKINGVDGRKDDFVPFDSNDFYWWCDVRARDLGCRGQKVSLFAINTVNGKDARGLDKKGYLEKKGRVGMGFQGIAAWEVD
ncbi:hypothetical protein F5884DRAFT_762918 [Xylogone sp. PMI_703]|nr:hypothetical protein F5884DRAFT_762918 [Xylogone sp. PMI_703]